MRSPRYFLGWRENSANLIALEASRIIKKYLGGESYDPPYTGRFLSFLMFLRVCALGCSNKRVEEGVEAKYDWS